MLFVCLIDTSSGRSGYGFSGTDVDTCSFLFNSDSKGGKNQDGTRIHMSHGGSVSNNSILWNGDMDPTPFSISSVKMAQIT
jgi:hypothetical protein